MFTEKGNNVLLLLKLTWREISDSDLSNSKSSVCLFDRRLHVPILRLLRFSASLTSRLHQQTLAWQFPGPTSQTDLPMNASLRVKHKIGRNNLFSDMTGIRDVPVLSCSSRLDVTWFWPKINPFTWLYQTTIWRRSSSPFFTMHKTLYYLRSATWKSWCVAFGCLCHIISKVTQAVPMPFFSTTTKPEMFKHVLRTVMNSRSDANKVNKCSQHTNIDRVFTKLNYLDALSSWTIQPSPYLKMVANQAALETTWKRC